MAIVLSLQSLLPITLLLKKVLADYSNSEYAKWLSSTLLLTSWNRLFIFSNMYLFGCMPFAFLYNEAADYKRSFFSRLLESLLQLFLVQFQSFFSFFLIS